MHTNPWIIPSWKASISTPCQEIPRILWKPKVHNRIYNSTPLLLTLRQINPVQSPILFLEDPLWYYSTICVWVLQVVAFLKASGTKRIILLGNYIGGIFDFPGTLTAWSLKFVISFRHWQRVSFKIYVLLSCTHMWEEPTKCTLFH